MINVGVIGLGHNAIAHLDAHFRIKKSKITALCDINKKLLDECGEKYGVTNLYTSAEELCADSNVSAVSINTGDQYHMEPFLSAVKHKKHIFIEKPVANTIEQLDKMIDAVKNCPVELKIGVGFVLRFSPIFEEIHEICRSGKLGKIFYMEGDYFHNLLYQKDRANPVTGENWYLKYEKPLASGGIHPIDLMRWFIGEKLVETTGLSNNIGFPEMTEHDLQLATFKFESGAIAKCTTSYSCRCKHFPFYNIRVFGTKGSIICDEIALSKDDNDVTPDFVPIGKEDAPGHPYDPEIYNWLQAIETNGAPRCDFFDGVNSTYGILVADQAIKAKATLPLKHIE